jgi:hypothetical protein
MARPFGGWLYLAEPWWIWLRWRLWFPSGQIWRRFYQLWQIGGWRQPTPPFFFLHFSVVGHPCVFAHCHVVSHDWATWQPFIGPHHPLAQSPCHVLYGLPRGCMDCHVALSSLVHGLTRKCPKMSDTWQPLVLPRHHADVSMTCVALCVCHVHCMDADVIRTDADVSSTDVDSSLLTGLG